MINKKHNPVNKYVRTDQFVKYCKANNVDASLFMLERYEKVNLLYPIYRFVVPSEYVHAVFSNSQKKIYPSKLGFNSNAIWNSITQLQKELGSYSYPGTQYFKKTLSKGHPLDVAYNDNCAFLHKPLKDNIRPWAEFKTVVGYADGYPITERTAEHYYAPWQIFALEELNCNHTILENYVIGLRKGKCAHNKELFPSELLIYSELFQTTCEFRMKESLILSDIAANLKGTVIEGKLHDQLVKRTAATAQVEFKKHSYSEWIEFVRKTVELYKEYTKNEKICLTIELKSFLVSVLQIIMDATKRSLEQISDDYDGKHKGTRGIGLIDNIIIYSEEILQIFPDEMKVIKGRGQKVIKGYLEEFNKELSNSEQIDQEIQDELIDNIIKSGHDFLLSHLHEIEYLWFNRKLHWRSSIWAHLRSFAISIESIGHMWFCGNYFSDILTKAFGIEYEKLKDKFDKNIVYAKNLSEYEKKLRKVLGHHKKNLKRICGYHLIIALLTRNYLSHNVEITPAMLGSLFLEVYKSLVFTLISLFIKYICAKNFTCNQIK